MKKNLVKYLAGLVVLLIVFSIVAKKKGWIGKPNLLAVYVEKPQTRTITESITANGRIQPEVEINISSEVSGEIIELPVKEGDWVEKGTLLVKIKPDTYISLKERAIASVKSAKARLAQSKAQLAQRKIAFNRSKKLFEQKAISESEFETAKTNYEVAQAEYNAAEFSVESAEASVKEADENLRKTSIFSPISGTVSKLNVELGERVLGTIQMAGTELMRIANLNRMEARVDVNENDIVKVKIGDTALIEVDAYLGRKFKGVVTQIANTANVQGQSTDQVTNFEVRIFILESSYKDLITDRRVSPFRPGMSTTVEILTKTKSNVLCVPILAVTTRVDTSSSGTKRIGNFEQQEENRSAKDIRQESADKKDVPQEIIFVVRGDSAFKVPVKTGIQDNRFIEVVEGITPDDEIVTAPYRAIARKLKDGMLIRRVKSKDMLLRSSNK